MSCGRASWQSLVAKLPAVYATRRHTYLPPWQSGSGVGQSCDAAYVIQDAEQYAPDEERKALQRDINSTTNVVMRAKQELAQAAAKRTAKCAPQLEAPCIKVPSHRVACVTQITATNASSMEWLLGVC